MWTTDIFETTTQSKEGQDEEESEWQWMILSLNKIYMSIQRWLTYKMYIIFFNFCLNGKWRDKIQSDSVEVVVFSELTCFWMKEFEGRFMRSGKWTRFLLLRLSSSLRYISDSWIDPVLSLNCHWIWSNIFFVIFILAEIQSYQQLIRTFLLEVKVYQTQTGAKEGKHWFTHFSVVGKRTGRGWKVSLTVLSDCYVSCLCCSVLLCVHDIECRYFSDDIFQSLEGKRFEGRKVHL